MKVTKKQKTLYILLASVAGLMYFFKDEINKGITTVSQQLSLIDFVNKYKPYALATQQKFNVPFQVTLAQAILESGYGKSAPRNNFFGIKWTSGEKQYLNTKEYNSTTKKMENKLLAFQVFASPEDSFNKHAELLKRVYSFAFVHTDPKKFAAALTERSYPKYATDPNYTSKLVKLIDQINGVN